jgi:hypothetical protein
MNNIYLFTAIEDWPAEALLGYLGAGQRTMDLLMVRRDGDASTEEYQLAETLVFTTLSRGCMEKVTRGAQQTKSPNLGTLWDHPDNQDKDCAPGTFGELLRYGAVNFRQKREAITTVPAVRPNTTWKKGVFEPWE